MTNIHKINLIETALYMLGDKKKEFCMLVFSDMIPGEFGCMDPQEAAKCGTACCFAGYGPHAGIKAKRNEGWGSYIFRVFGVCGAGPFTFLFSADWPSDKVFAAQRALFLMERGHVPQFTMGTEDIEGFDDYWPLSKTKVINRLKKLQTTLSNG